MKKIIFTDLDGTLLDHETYSYKPAENAISNLKKSQNPIIFCTSKTRAEIEYLREKIGITDPFISENGGGIFIPKNYFSFDFKFDSEDSNYYIINPKTKINELKNAIKKLKENYEIISFLDMTPEEISEDTNLTPKQAQLAKKREFDLPFKILNEGQEEKIINHLKEQGFKTAKGGRYFHVMGNYDKGRAVRLLTHLFEKEFKDIFTIGLGDSENDFPMLENVDSPYLVMKKDRSYASSEYTLAGDVGPKGWKNVIELELEK
jgi:mannosyl-3-phosphoglycerate phosphatase